MMFSTLSSIRIVRRLRTGWVRSAVKIPDSCQYKSAGLVEENRNKFTRRGLLAAFFIQLRDKAYVQEIVRLGSFRRRVGDLREHGFHPFAAHVRRIL